MAHEQRLDELESKIAFQEHTIELLNDEISELTQRMLLMQRQIELLAQRVKSQKTSVVASESEETPPPHY